MKPLTVDDLIPLEEFTARRAEFLDAHLRYCNRYRRVRVGPSATLLFENRQTLWFRMQEVLRIARVTEPEMVQLELDWYNQLLPARDHLQAALILDGGLTCSAARLRLSARGSCGRRCPMARIRDFHSPAQVAPQSPFPCLLRN